MTSAEISALFPGMKKADYAKAIGVGFVAALGGNLANPIISAVHNASATSGWIWAPEAGSLLFTVGPPVVGAGLILWLNLRLSRRAPGRNAYGFALASWVAYGVMAMVLSVLFQALSSWLSNVIYCEPTSPSEAFIRLACHLAAALLGAALAKRFVRVRTRPPMMFGGQGNAP